MDVKRRLAVIGIRGFPGVQGGVESHCQQLIPLISESFKCRVYRRKPYLTGTSVTDEYNSIEFVDLSSTRIKGFETVLHTLLSCLHLIFHRVDVVNIHNIGPAMFAPLLRLFGMKVVLTYHSPNYEHAKWGLFSRLLLRTSEKIALKFSNHIIFVSPIQRAKYSDKIQAKSTAIPNGITPLGFDYNDEFLKSRGIEPKKYILAVGRLTPEKGFDNLIRAVNKCKGSHRLVIAGAADHNPEYLKYLKSLDENNRTVFAGYTTGSNLAQLYTHAALYVLSSHNEGFPMVLLEAMSHNLSIVSTDIPAAHIIPLPDSHYCNHDDYSDMARVIDFVISQNECPVYNLSSYDWDSIARQTLSVYDEVLNR